MISSVESIDMTPELQHTDATARLSRVAFRGRHE
jgi:hypothetical protein